MKKFFFNHSPKILGVLGVFFALMDFIVDKIVPESFDNTVWLLNGVMFLFCGVTCGVMIKRLYRVGQTDALTGARNRGYFYSRLLYEMKGLRKKRKSLSLLMIDIDDFKSINDTYGHLLGDKVLKQMTVIFRKNLNSEDSVIRWGGEEFAIILSGAGASEARKTAETIRSSIERNSFCHQIPAGNITISIGIAVIDRCAEIEEFVKIADEALYEAKKKKNSIACLNTLVEHKCLMRVSSL